MIHITSNTSIKKRAHKSRLLTYQFLLALLLCMCAQLSLSQTFENDTESEEVTGEEIIIDNTTVDTNVLNALGFQTDFAPQPNTIVGNLVSIRQIGDFNSANVATRTQNSDIDVFQNGNNNEIDLNYNSQSAFALLSQQGNSNRIIDFVSEPNSNPALDLTQQGSNLSFERYGVNNLTNSLKFTQTEASPAIIVRSYQ